MKLMNFEQEQTEKEREETGGSNYVEDYQSDDDGDLSPSQKLVFFSLFSY